MGELVVLETCVKTTIDCHIELVTVACLMVEDLSRVENREGSIASPVPPYQEEIIQCKCSILIWFNVDSSRAVVGMNWFEATRLDA